jgi:hypothetical protein
VTAAGRVAGENVVDEVVDGVMGSAGGVQAGRRTAVAARATVAAVAPEAPGPARGAGSYQAQVVAPVAARTAVATQAADAREAGGTGGDLGYGVALQGLGQGSGHEVDAVGRSARASVAPVAARLAVAPLATRAGWHADDPVAIAAPAAGPAVPAIAAPAPTAAIPGIDAGHLVGDDVRRGVGALHADAVGCPARAAVATVPAAAGRAALTAIDIVDGIGLQAGGRGAVDAEAAGFTPGSPVAAVAAATGLAAVATR